MKTSNPNVEAVIINKFRPENVAKIIRALRAQVGKITILDCAGAGAWEEADQVIIFPSKDQDPGPWVRYAMAGMYEHPDTLLVDDDILPNPNMVELFAEAAEKTGSPLIGALGRVLGPAGEYKAENCPPGPADIIVRCYFWNTEDLKFCAAHADRAFAKDQRYYDDDIATAAYLKKKPHVIDSVPWTELPSPNAVCAMPGHLERRDAFCREIWHPANPVM